MSTALLKTRRKRVRICDPASQIRPSDQEEIHRLREGLLERWPEARMMINEFLFGRVNSSSYGPEIVPLDPTPYGNQVVLSTFNSPLTRTCYECALVVPLDTLVSQCISLDTTVYLKERSSTIEYHFCCREHCSNFQSRWLLNTPSTNQRFRHTEYRHYSN